MENRIALVGIVVENAASSEGINAILHENAEFIVGRMGIPYRQRQINIISVVLDAPQPTVAAMTGKLGMLPGVSVKTIYSKEK